MTELAKMAIIAELKRQFIEGEINEMSIFVPRYIEVHGQIDVDALAQAIIDRISP